MSANLSSASPNRPAIMAATLMAAAVSSAANAAEARFSGMTCQMDKICEPDLQNCAAADWAFDVNANAGGFPASVSWGGGWLEPETAERSEDAVTVGTTDENTRTSYMFVLGRNAQPAGVYVSTDPQGSGTYRLENVYIGKCEELG